MKFGVLANIFHKENIIFQESSRQVSDWSTISLSVCQICSNQLNNIYQPCCICETLISAQVNVLFCKEGRVSSKESKSCKENNKKEIKNLPLQRRLKIIFMQ